MKHSEAMAYALSAAERARQAKEQVAKARSYRAKGKKVKVEDREELHFELVLSQGESNLLRELLVQARLFSDGERTTEQKYAEFREHLISDLGWYIEDAKLLARKQPEDG